MRRAGDELRHGGNAPASMRIHDLGAYVEIGAEIERCPESLMQRSSRQAAVTHPREDVQSMYRDPVSGAFIAEDLAPTPRARRPAPALAIADRAGSGDDVDAVFAPKRTCPGA